jgi:ABC-type amino acid transport substrate-binding protein
LGVIYSRPEIPIRSFLDLKDKRIALMKAACTTLEKEYPPHSEPIRHLAEFLEYDSYSDVLLALDNGQADVGVVNNIFGGYFEKDYNVVRSPSYSVPLNCISRLPKTVLPP